MRTLNAETVHRHSFVTVWVLCRMIFSLQLLGNGEGAVLLLIWCHGNGAPGENGHLLSNFCGTVWVCKNMQYSTIIMRRFRPIPFSDSAVHRLLFVLYVQETRRRGRKQDEAGKRARERRVVESAPVTDTTPEDVNQQIPDSEDFEQRSVLYKTLLHKKASLAETYFHFLKTEQEQLLACEDLPCCHYVNAWSAQVFVLFCFFEFDVPLDPTSV